jgi:hypothetical protein
MFVVDKMGKDGSFRSLRERRPNRICHCSRIRADLWLVAVHPSDDAAGGRFRQIDPSRPRHEADPPNRGHIFSLSRAGMRCRKGGRAEHVAPLFICCCSWPTSVSAHMRGILQFSQTNAHHLFSSPHGFISMFRGLLGADFFFRSLAFSCWIWMLLHDFSLWWWSKWKLSFYRCAFSWRGAELSGDLNWRDLKDNFMSCKNLLSCCFTTGRVAWLLVFCHPVEGSIDWTWPRIKQHDAYFTASVLPVSWHIVMAMFETLWWFFLLQCNATWCDSMIIRNV